MPKEGLEAEAACTIQLKTSEIVHDEEGTFEADRGAKCAIVHAVPKPVAETPAHLRGDRKALCGGDRKPVCGGDDDGAADVDQLVALCRAVEALLEAGSSDLARIALGQLRGLLEAARGPGADIVDLLGRRPR